MATPVRDETRNVTDDNISTQVQSKVNIQDTTKEFKKIIIDTSIENKQRKQALIDLETYEIFLNKLTTKKNKITNEVKQDDDISNLDQLMEVDEKIEKTSKVILGLQKKLESIDFDKDDKKLHERNDSTGTYYLFDTLTSKNRKFYPKDWVFKHKMTKIGNIPVFLNSFQQFIEKYEFDNIFDQQIQNIDPRENEILCKVIKEGFNESPDIMNINTSDIFRIIRDLKKKYTSLFGRDVRQKAWQKLLVDTTCKDTDLLMNELQKLVLMEKWIFSKCCQNCPNLTHLLEEAILGTLHESLRNSVKQRLHIYSIGENERIEEILINIIIETVMDLSSIDSYYSERNCIPRPTTQKVIIRKVQPKRNTLKQAQNPSELLENQRKKNKKGSNKNLVIIDTGSGVNITNNKSILHDYKDNKEKVKFFGIGKNNSVPVRGSGYIKIKCNTNDDYLLAHYVPEEETTIISGYELARETNLVLSKNYSTLENNEIKIKTHVQNGIIHVKMDDLIDHAVYDGKINAIQPTSKKIRLKPKIISLKDAHKRMGHTGVQQLEKSIKHSHYEESIELIKDKNEFWCETCKVSKATRRNHYAGSMNEHSIDHEPGSSWCMDIFGPVSNSNSDTKRYMLIMVDNNTRYCITSTHFNKNAETILAQIKKNIQYVETQFDRKVREINSDQGTEFTNDQLAKYFVSKGIHHIFSATQDHAANGRAERYIRTIVTDATTLLKHSNLRIKFWEYAVTSATNVRNCLENKATGQLPLQAISSQPVKVRFMSFLPFGEQGIIWNHNHNKLKPSGLRAIILCKDPNSHGYKFFVPSIKKILTSDNYTIPNYAVETILRNTQNIYLDDRSRSDSINEAENSDAVSRLYDALENYEDDHKQVTLLTDLFTTEELDQIDENAKYPSPSDNLEGNLDYVFANIEEDEEDEYNHVINMDIDTDLLSKEKITVESDRNEIKKSGNTDEDILDENVYRIPTALQENLVGSQNTININNDDNIASRMQRKISGNEINYKESSEDEGNFSSHDPTIDSVTVASKKDNVKDDIILQSQQESSENTVDPEVLLEKDVDSKTSSYDTSQYVDVQTESSVTLLKDKDVQNDDYSTHKESHHLPLVVKVMDNTDQTYFESNKVKNKNNLDKSISPKGNNEELVQVVENSEAEKPNAPLESLINKAGFLNKTFNSLNMKRKRPVENRTSFHDSVERDNKRQRRNIIKLLPDNTETSSAPRIKTIYYNEAISGNADLKEKHAYKEAYRKELQNLKDMKVFDVDVKYNRSDVPSNLIIPTNTIFSKKRNGIYKARIVCRGDIQTPDTYNVIGTESLNHNHIKIFLMIANNRNMFMKTLDINHAFLYAKLEEDIYIPHPHDRRCVVKLDKALYGLKQSPKEWNDHLRRYLNSVGLKDNTYTPGLYQSKDKKLMIAVYVDDCVIAASDEQRLDDFINNLKGTFELKITGTLIDDILDTDILGMNLIYNRKLGTIDLTLKSFIEKMGEKYKKELDKVRKRSIPHISIYKIDPKNGELKMTEKEYKDGVLKLQQLLGELNYVRYKCRYDVEFAVKKVARLVNFPHKQVFYMIYKIIQYLVQHTNIGIHYDRDFDIDKKITTITDASVGTEYDAQSRIGVIIWYGKNIFNVYSNKSSNKCVSSTEAELHAIYEGYADSETLKVTLTEGGEGGDKELTMLTDSKPAIEGLNRSYLQPKQKFTWIKTEIIKEKIKEKKIKLIKIKGKENIADLLTKPVSISDFDRFIKVLKNQITPQDILASTDY